MRHLWIFSVLAISSLAWGDADTEIRITLFGQPCLLSGPVNESTLKTIHSISPEKIPPSQNIEQARQTLERLKKITHLPGNLENYRDRLIKHVEAQIAFFNGWAAAKKAGKPDPLLASVRPYVQGKREKEFEAAAKKLWEPAPAISPVPTVSTVPVESPSPAQSVTNSTVTLESLMELYNDVIEQAPEEEFHRAISKLKIRYTCEFGENE